MKTIVLATSNQGKLRELQHALEGFNIELKPQSAFGITNVPEDNDTFIENAIDKARFVAEMTGLPSIADDSGIEVDYLKGAPGVLSARFAGDHGNMPANIDKLLKELDGVAASERSARFRCVTVYLRHPKDPSPLICQGVWEGQILTERRGEHGFGYDPVFFLPDLNCSAAELTIEAKQKVSHRGQALRCIKEKLGKELADG